MRYIDVRSDTVTLPTQAMRDAMAKAPVGDDVYGDDPTVKELEKLAAQKLGKEQAMFVPSGTFGNLMSILTHTGRGDEIILEKGSHIVIYEVASAAVFAGVQMRTLQGKGGAMDPAEVEASIRPEDIHQPPTGLICLENAHTRGSVLPLENMRAIREISLRRSIPVHLDGARLFNAAHALGADPKELASCADSVMICLSKGLCAPVGSIVAGEGAFIARARKYRKMLGGGLRQAGILAAAGIIALEEMTGRLGEDHANARYLADGLERLGGIAVDREHLDINMVYWQGEEGRIGDPKALADGLLQKGIKASPPREGAPWRFVTNHGVSRADVDTLLAAMSALLG